MVCAGDGGMRCSPFCFSAGRSAAARTLSCAAAGCPGRVRPAEPSDNASHNISGLSATIKVFCQLYVQVEIVGGKQNMIGSPHRFLFSFFCLK